MGKDFREFRSVVLDQEDSRKLMDMRRTGSVEANTAGASVEAISAKPSNSINQNKALQRVYMPGNLSAVRAADQSRKVTRRELAAGQD